MKTKKIYYHPAPKGITCISDLRLPPQKNTEEYSSKFPFYNCPAWKHQNKRTFTVYASSHIHLQIEENAGKVYAKNLNQSEFNEYILLDDNWNNAETSVIQIVELFSDFYWTEEKNIWISVLPHPLTSVNNNFYHCGAWFNLSNWPRLVNLGAIVVDKSKPIVIKRGDPIYNIKFHTENQNDNFILESKEIDQKKYNEFYHRQKFILAKNHSFEYNYQNVLFDSNKKSKCPFKFLWK